MNGLENYKCVLDQLEKLIHLVNENLNNQSAECKLKKLHNHLSSKYYDLCSKYYEGMYEVLNRTSSIDLYSDDKEEPLLRVINSKIEFEINVESFWQTTGATRKGSNGIPIRKSVFVKNGRNTNELKFVLRPSIKKTKKGKKVKEIDFTVKNSEFNEYLGK